MKNFVRVLSSLLAMILCIGLLGACGAEESTPTKAATQNAPTEVITDGTEPFVAPPDAIGLVVSADNQIITWKEYPTDEETIDFKSVDVKKLGKTEDMSIYYMESEVTYYSVAGGKLEKVTLDDVVPGSIVGVTTLEEGVQEVYILYVPAENDGADETEDPLEYVEETVPTETTAPIEDTPADEESEIATEPEGDI